MVITGASGFLGRKLEELALLQGWKVLGINRYVGPNSILFDDPNLETYLNEFSPDVIVHLAASYGAEAKDLQANLLFPLRLLKWSAQKSNLRFVAAGTFWQFGDVRYPGPIDLYSTSKQSLSVFMDYYRRCHSLDCYQLIFSSCYGYGDPRKKIIDYLVEAAEQGLEVQVGSKDKVFALTDVRDVANSIMMLSSSSKRLPLLTYRVRTDDLWSFDTLKALFAKLGYALHLKHVVMDSDTIEILQPNDSDIPTLPGWAPQYTLTDYLVNRLSKSMILEPKGNG